MNVGPAQLILPLAGTESFSRADFFVSPANVAAVAFLDSWPNWPAKAAAIYGPSGVGKTHLAHIWATRSRAAFLPADALSGGGFVAAGPVVVEDIDRAEATEGRDIAVFGMLEAASRGSEVLFTGREPPVRWDVRLPDLASRFAALLALPLGPPDEEALCALARKLLSDRQLAVPDAVITRMLQSLERSPDAVRRFVACADEKALAEKRPFNLSLVRELLSGEFAAPS